MRGAGCGIYQTTVYGHSGKFQEYGDYRQSVRKSLR